MTPILRVGVLGAARVTPGALIKPAAGNPEVMVQAIAARSPERARVFAAKHSIPVVHDSYQDLIADPGIDAVYVPLPNSLHGRWTVAAANAGKHVLCEKPFSANAREARRVADALISTRVVVMEALHYRYHPLMSRVLGLLRHGVIGEVRHIEARLSLPISSSREIAYRHDLAGGCVMVSGYYCLHVMRLLGTDEPTVVEARAKTGPPGVDRMMRADLRFPGGATGRCVSSMRWRDRPGLSFRVFGEHGEIRAFNFAQPGLFHRLTVRTPERKWHERLEGESSYACQLRAFTAAALHGEPVLTSPADAVATMRLVDDVYMAAGLAPRAEAS